jgi:hypothetical protein
MFVQAGYAASGFIAVSFAALTLIMVALVVFAVGRAADGSHHGPAHQKRVAAGVTGALLLWLTVTGALTLTGFFAQAGTTPPRFVLGVLPAVAVVLALVLFPRSRAFLAAVPAAWVVAFQAFRIPVELTLWALSGHSMVPAAMTFEGRNFDILTGLTAPVVAYFCFVRGVWPRWIVVAWNALGLLLLANVVRIAILAAPGVTPMVGGGGGEAPNLLPSLFPFAWLPYFLVPLALFGHLVSLAQLGRRTAETAHRAAARPEGHDAAAAAVSG